MTTTRTAILIQLSLAAIAIAQDPFRSTRQHELQLVAAGGDITFGDVDGDGNLDLVVANGAYPSVAPNQLFLGDGRGGFVDATSGRLSSPALNRCTAVDLVDIDGDGDLDLLACQDHAQADRVYENTGTGMFVDVTATALPPNADWSVDQVVGDFDGDGDADWLLQIEDDARLYLNDGTGSFTDVTATNLPPSLRGKSWPQGAMAHDLDDDGDLDVLFPTNGALRLGILVNDGGATFSVVSSGLYSAIVADLDGDGRSDLVSELGWLRRNLGGMTFAPITSLGIGGTVSAAFDYDEDGDVDLIGNHMIHRHDGQGGFTAVNAQAMSVGAPRIAIDIDGDRDIDFVGPFGIAVNFFRQVDAPAAPQLGQPYAVEFTVPTDSASTPLFAAVSTAGAIQPIPGLGTLRLLPAAAVALPLLTATNGTVSIALPIPNQTGFFGVELHYQAITFDPLRPPVLGNATRDVIQ